MKKRMCAAALGLATVVFVVAVPAQAKDTGWGGTFHQISKTKEW